MQSKPHKLMQGALIMGLLVFSLAGCQPSPSPEAEEALAFLYENMPLPDSVDYPREFWQRSVEATLQAKREMPWGKKIPARVWRHFVLPVRVNNENLDDARTVLYRELKERVKGLTMYSAVLEVNHWCHEHVTYQPSDARTTSPLTTMRSAVGRCGEESTFTVAALRAVGIPARQVYTPRWAHTDDNHAWVEAWVDGRWRFIGACEPEPVLDLGWFNAPASRGMLMHTKVFGLYDGPEEVVSRNRCYTEINVTANYAPVDSIVVRALDAEGCAVADATVDYRLYNYAEFYSLVSKQTDSQGLSKLTCGLGDLVVWVSKDGRFGFEKASVGRQDTVVVRLIHDGDGQVAFRSLDLDLTPPAERNNVPELTAEQVRKNRKRLAVEDSIRAAYMQQTFLGKGGLEEKARANWQVVHDALALENGEALLGTLRDKDLCDVTLDVLSDHAGGTVRTDHPLWARYVLCPRVANEMLTCYRDVLNTSFRGMRPDALVQWMRDSLLVDDSRNPQHLCMSPLGVLRHRVTDSHSRDIFFVSAARSIGIPARIDEVTGKVQWADADCQWHDVVFGEKAEETAPQGTLVLTYKDFDVKDNPIYYTHFTISRLDGGRPHLQEFPEEGCTWEGTFRDGVRLDAGDYVLVSGTRLADGGVLSHVEFFSVPVEGTVRVPLKLRDSRNELRVIGSFNCENYFTNVKGTHKTILQTTGRGYYVVGLIRSGHEPSTHILHDFEEVNIHISQWPHCILLLFPSQEEYDAFNRKDFGDLPDNFVFGVADPETVEAMHIQELTHGSTELPILMMCDTFNRVVWFHQGYTIGIGEKVMQVIRRLMKVE